MKNIIYIFIYYFFLFIINKIKIYINFKIMYLWWNINKNLRINDKKINFKKFNYKVGLDTLLFLLNKILI